MAYTPLKVAIPEPCHEDWNGMHPVSGSSARHCDSCAKNVVDFTGFSDAQLHAFVRENPGKLCGRFRPDQIDRPLRASSAPSRNPLRVAATAAGLLLAGGAATAQTVPTPTPAQTEQPGKPRPSMDHPAILGRVAHFPAPDTVKDTVQPPRTGETAVLPADPPPPPRPVLMGEPVMSPAPPPVCDKGIVQDTVDFDPEEFLVGDISVGLPESTDGPDTLPAPPPPPPPPPPHDMQVMGFVVMEPIRPTGLDLVKDTLRKLVTPAPPTTAPTLPPAHPRPRPLTPPEPVLELDLTVGPNPFVDELRLDHLAEIEQTLSVEIIDQRGRSLLRRKWTVTSGKNQLALNLNRRVPLTGMYFLRVTDGEGRRTTRTLLRREIRP